MITKYSTKIFHQIRHGHSKRVKTTPTQIQYNTITYTITTRFHLPYFGHLTIVHCFRMLTSHSHTYLFDHFCISNVKEYRHFHPINNNFVRYYTVNTVQPTRARGPALKIAYGNHGKHTIHIKIHTYMTSVVVNDQIKSKLIFLYLSQTK